MKKVHPFITAFLLTAGLAACGQPATTAEKQDAATTENAEIDNAGDAVATAAETAAPAAPEALPAKAQAATVTALPLKRGFYVASDTPCGQASNATTSLLRRNGIGGSRYFCEFKKIEQTGPNVYRVTEACGDLQEDAPPEIGITTYTLSGDTRFTSKNAQGGTDSARYCAQSNMPPDWRENDISDVTG